MEDAGLQADFTAAARAQADSAAAQSAGGVQDQRQLPWISIDNDDSRDLDQLSVAVPAQGNATRLLVAIADVDSLVPLDSPIDDHARFNTTSVYTAGGIFTMLPERLCYDLTSLVQDADRLAIVTDMTVAADGTVSKTDIYRAVVRNKAKLAYDSTSAWLDGKGAVPAPLAAAKLEEQLKLQDRLALALGQLRHQRGALTLESLETRAVFDGDVLRDLIPQHQNRTQELIENVMVAANGAAARWLQDRGQPSIRRVLRTPEHWDRIMALAAESGGELPAIADAAALNRFLAARRKADPARFPDLSLAVIKLLGRGEYALERPGEPIEGHFGLAVNNYMHSTAPNRRYPDIITQRLIKAVLAAKPSPYSTRELGDLAQHCTQQEDVAAKVERRVSKSAAALLLSHRLGETFDAMVTGASDKGTWARTLSPPAEGRITQDYAGLHVGQRIRVRLLRTDVEHGFIDFARAS